MEKLQHFAEEWNVSHPELPAVLRGSDVLIFQDKFPYGNITVEVRSDGYFDIYVSKYDGEEMEPEPLELTNTVEGAVRAAEWGVHPGVACAVCGKEQSRYFSWNRTEFWKIGCRLYCTEHKP